MKLIARYEAWLAARPRVALAGFVVAWLTALVCATLLFAMAR